MEQAVNSQVQQPNVQPQVAPEPKHQTFLTNKLFLITLAIVVLFTFVYAGIYLYLGSQLDQISKSNKTVVTQPSPTPDPTANWKTYTYKSVSFKHPSDWVVIFDSVVENQPDGFSLHVQHKDAGGYQSDGLYISTYNDRKFLTGNSVYSLMADRKFTKTDSGDDYIQFEVNGIPIYAGCAFYSEGYDTLAICDQILSTFKFTDQEEQVVCTQDVKLCPDGSYVSRQPPNCEFAKCP